MAIAWSRTFSGCVGGFRAGSSQLDGPGTQGLTTTGKHYDAFDAFAWPGYVGQLTTSDINELVALGCYKLPTV